MATGDDRKIPTVRTEPDGSVSAQSLNEIIRQLHENIYKIEGRVGEITLRSDTKVMGGLTLDARVDGVNSDPPEVAPSDKGRLYFDLDGKFKVSEDGSTYRALSPVFHTDVTNVGNAAGADTDAMGFVLPANTLAQDGDALHMLTAVTCANNANAGKGISLFLNSTSPLTHGPSTFQNQIITLDVWLIRSGTQIRLSNRSSNGAAGAGVAVFMTNTLVSEDPAEDIEVRWKVLGSSGAGDTTQNFLLAYVWAQ